MAIKKVGEKLKFRLKYDKGSQTFSGCNPVTDDETLYHVAQTIISLRKDETVEITKIIESDLIEQE